MNLQEAMRHAKFMGLSSFQLASDSQTLINLIKSKTNRLEIGVILHDIHLFSSDLKIVSFEFVQREKNLEADGLAKTALSNVMSIRFLLV